MFETFLILRRNDRDMTKNVYWASCKVPFILVRFQRNLGFLDRFFRKSSNIKFHENPSTGNRVLPWERTTRHEANSRFSQFYEKRLKIKYSWNLCYGWAYGEVWRNLTSCGHATKFNSNQIFSPAVLYRKCSLSLMVSFSWSE